MREKHPATFKAKIALDAIKGKNHKRNSLRARNPLTASKKLEKRISEKGTCQENCILFISNLKLNICLSS